MKDHLQKNETIILMFFLHISEKEQKSKIEQRLTDPEIKWKYTAKDAEKAKKWDDYMKLFSVNYDGEST